jgi:uncharacterized integral membrane protein
MSRLVKVSCEMDQVAAEAPYVLATVAVIAVVGLPMLLLFVFRLLSHRERMEMIRHGYVPAAGAGYGLERDASATVQLRRGVSVACIGLALTIGLSFIGFRGGEFVLGPWLLGGLIPLFAGVAQMLNARINGARFSGAQQPAQYGPARGESPRSIFETQQSEQEKRPPV